MIPITYTSRSLAGLAAALAVMPSAAAAQQPAPPEHSPPTLNGVVLLAARDQLVEAGWPADPHGVDATRLPDLAGAAAQKSLHDLLGKPITAELLQTLRATIAKDLEAVHRPFASVIIPRQQVHDGVMQVVVLEAHLGKVKVEGAHYFAPEQYRAAVPIASGAPIDSDALAAAANAINANHYRQAAIIASPGEELGATDLTIKAQDRLPIGVNLGVDNTGNLATGLYRVNAGLDWGNAFWRGDDLNVQYTTSSDFYRLRQYALTYTSQLPWGGTVTLSGNLADTHSVPSGLVSNSGLTYNLSGRYTIALPPLGPLGEHLTFGYDYKSTNNNILFGGSSVFPSTTEIGEFSIGLDASAADPYGATHASLTVYDSPGGLSAHDNDAAFASQQAGAKADYVYARLTLDRLTPLAAGLAWRAAVTAQLSSGILLPSEELPFGGVQSVRGFVESEETRDEGVLVQNELRAPQIIGLGRLLHIGDEKDVLTPFAFLDVGAGVNHQNFAGRPDTALTLVSTGPGLTWQFAPHANARFSWGVPVLREGAAGPLLGPQFGVQVGF